MSGISQMVFGDGGKAKRAAEESQRIQGIANDRQLAELQRQDESTGTMRRAPRGRRLFEDGPAKASRVLG